MNTLKNKLAFAFCIFFTSVFSQTFNWSGYPTNGAIWTPSANFNMTKANAGGGSFDVRESGSGGVSLLGFGTSGNTAQNCGLYTGLRLEMSGAGNGAGTGVWNNSETITINFPNYLCAPVTFNIYDITEAIYNDGTTNWVYYQDKVAISALDNANNPVIPGVTLNGAIDNVVVGNTRVLTANNLNGQCKNQAMSVGVVGQQIKQITIVYSNQDLPTHCPAPAGSPVRYGISQYQYVFISPITGTAPPTASISSPTLACGTTSTTLTGTTTAGAPTYSWTGPGGSTVSSPTTSATAVSGVGVYTLVINPGGCSSTAIFNIGSGGAPPNVTATASTTLNCTTTTIQATATTTSTPVIYNWSGPGILSGGTSSVAVVNTAGTYNYTVINTGTGCSTTGTLAVTQNTSVVTATSAATNSLNCTTTTAQAILTTTTAPVNYNWTGTGITSGAGTATINVNQGGTFNYTVTNTSDGCKTTGSQAISQNTVLPSPTATSPNSITCSTSTVSLNGGPAALTYTWSGPGFSGGTNSQNAIATTTGNYTLSVTGANGCTNSTVTSVGSNNTPPAATASLSSVINCTSTSANLSGGPASGVTYSWTGVGLSGGITSAIATVTNTGNYTLTTTSTVNGCVNTAVVTVTANTTVPQISVGPDLTINCVTQSTTLNGSSSTPGVTYAWTGPTGVLPAGSTPTNSTSIVSAPGTYTLTVTNPANGCSSSIAEAVTQNTTPPNITVGSSQTITCTSLLATLTGNSTTNPVNYSWTGPTGVTPAGTSPTSSTTSVSQGGTYTLTLTDPINSCTTSAVVSIIQNTTTPVVVSSTSNTLSCTNATINASATTTTSPVSYNWSGTGITSATNISTITVNQAGTFNYTVTNTSNGCFTTGSQVVSQNTITPIVTSSSSNTLSCTNVTVNASATTTTIPVSYNWSGAGIISASNISTITVNQAGTFNYTVTNTSSGCLTTGNISVLQNTITPIVATSISNTLTCTLTSINASATTTITPVSYNWSGTGITSATTISTITVNQSGTYNYTVTNTTTGCKTVGSLSVIQNTTTPVVASATSGVLNCTLTSINASATTTTTPVSYNWSGTGITSTTNISTITVNQVGTFNYTVTNTSNGCIATGLQTVTQNTTIPAATTTNGTLTCANTSTVLAGGPTSGVTYSWSGAGLLGATTLANATATNTGSYTLTTTSTTNGCTNTAVATVTNNLTTSIPNAGTTQTLVCGIPSVTLTGSATPIGTTVNWLGGVCGSATSFTTTACAPGTYTLVATNPVSGCTSISTVAVSSSTDVPQATVNAITNSITCTNSLVAIGVTLSNTDPVTYTWSGPGIIGATNTSTTTANIAGTYSVTITNTISNCQSIFNLIVPINTTSVSASVSSSSTITCLVVTNTLSATPTGTNYGYAWSGPGTIVNGTTENPIINAGGDYTVTITNNTNGCLGTTTVNVPTNTVSPTMSLTPSSLTTTCANPTATLLATSSSDPDATYSWTAPATGSLNNTNTNNPIANGSGVFTVQVTNTVSGCVSAIATISMTADANVPTLNATATNTTICDGNTSTLNITGADTYTWSTTANTPSITVTPPTTTTYSVTGTNTLTGCSNSTNIIINVNPTPTVNISASNTAICEGSNAIITLTGATNYTLTNPSQTTTNTIIVSPTVQTTYTVIGESTNCTSATSTITINVNTLPTIAVSNATTCAGSTVTLTATNADTYTWTATGTQSSTITVSPGIPTTYSVTGTNTLTGCTSTITTVDVLVNALPTVTAIANPNTTCTSGTVNLTANTTATSYTWTLGNGITTVNQNQSAVTFPASALATGTYTYIVSVTSPEGCVSSQSTAMLNIINIPNANFDLSDLTICQNQSGVISINVPQTNVIYDWNINGQSITNTNPLTVPVTVTNSTGIYTVSVISSLGTCTNTANNTLTVNALPTVALVKDNVSVCVNTSAQLDISNPNSTYGYIWTYNNQTVGNGISQIVNPLTQINAGTYTVTATDINGCQNRTTGVLDAQVCEIFIPEIFTPNGDGKNDGFVIKNIENYPNNKLKIFNRWGNMVYQKDGYLNEFEGFANTGDAVGKSKLPAGTYYVVLEYGDGTTETYNGFLLLQY